jgi:hypothetical protein
VVKKSMREQAAEGFYSGMTKADNSEPQVNLLINGCMMMIGGFAFAYVILHGPDMLLLRLVFLVISAIIAVTGYRNFRIWSAKIRESKDNAVASELSKELIEQKDVQ